MTGGAKTAAPPTGATEFGGNSGSEDVEDAELEALFRREGTVDKVKVEAFLLGCDGIMLANEVCGDPIDAVDIDTGERVGVATEAPSLEGDAVQI